ncbi:MAG TPA: tetratricopeptide repeat protein [Pseudonocardiaceae bacterium]|nr:tetratricopeptide repeat protein [Pseudonocardiaceae bacterium]
MAARPATCADRSRPAELSALTGLGDIHHRRGRLTQATAYAQQALDGARDATDRNAQYEAHQCLGRIQHTTNNYRESLDHHRAALELATDLDHPPDQVRAHDGLAHAHQSLSDPDQARIHWQAALDLLGMSDADITDEPEVTAVAIRTHLAQLEA